MRHRNHKPKQVQSSPEDRTKIMHAHTALNIALFPPLFFFSALYYTDVLSTLTVLLAYYAFLTRKEYKNSFVQGVIAVSVGVLALIFRQTNVFWVAVFPAGLAVANVLANLDETVSQPSALRSIQSIIEDAWSKGQVHDMPIEYAAPQGT